MDKLFTGTRSGAEKAVMDFAIMMKMPYQVYKDPLTPVGWADLVILFGRPGKSMDKVTKRALQAARDRNKRILFITTETTHTVKYYRKEVQESRSVYFGGPPELYQMVREVLEELMMEEGGRDASI